MDSLLFLLEEIVKSTEAFYAILPRWPDENSVEKKKKKQVRVCQLSNELF